VRLLIVRQADDVCLVRALGEIDLQTVADLDSALAQVQGDGHTQRAPIAAVPPLATQTMCDRCERRFVQPMIVQSSRCPLCDGKLAPFDERPNPNLLERPVNNGVTENGGR